MRRHWAAKLMSSGSAALAAQGTSSDRQLATFAAAAGDAGQAFAATVDWIETATAGSAS